MKRPQTRQLVEFQVKYGMLLPLIAIYNHVLDGLY
jgi:hypothetical protein